MSAVTLQLQNPPWWRNAKVVSRESMTWVLPRGRTPPVAETFNRLRTRWLRETQNESSIAEMIDHPAYQAIIDLGVAVVPHIVYAFRQEPNHWHSSLVAITGQDPVPDEHAGDLEAMAEDWWQWAEANAVIPTHSE